MAAATNVFGGFGVEFGAASPIGGITQYDLGLGSTVANETTSGSVYPEFPVLTGQEPEGNFSTIQIARALAACGLTGTALSGLTGGLKFYLRQRADEAARSAGSVHNKYSLQEGIVYPESLTCDHQGTATLQYKVVVTYDGTNNPIVVAINQALPAGLADDQQFTLGTMQVGGVTFDHVRQFTINFGLTPRIVGVDSDVWSQHVSFDEIKPSINLTGINPQWFGASGIPHVGLACTHANTILYLRKRLAKSTFTPDGTAEHVKFTGDGLATVDNALQVSGQDPSECSITIALRYDGTNVPLLVDTASTIT